MDGRELSNLDPLKRELLEARLTGLNKIMQTANQDSGSDSLCSTGDNNETPNNDKKRKRRTTDQLEGSNKLGRVDSSKKISEYFYKASASAHHGNSQSIPGHSPENSSESNVKNNNEKLSRFNYALEKQGKTKTEPIDIEDNDNCSDLSVVHVHQAVQTDTSNEESTNAVEKSENEISHSTKNREIERLQSTIDDLNREAEDRIQKITEHSKFSEMCKNLIKELIVEKAQSEKTAARKLLQENNLRLGHFTTSRHGANFVETWVDGMAFSELNREKEEINRLKEEFEKHKKQLLKRKPQVSTAKTKGGKTSNSSEHDQFVKPASNSLTTDEFYEMEEILKLRAAAIRKREADVLAELEKLERERTLHIRELKRIHNEDQSRFKDYPILSERYLLLHLIGKGGFSEVHKAMDLRELRHVACKIHQLNRDWKEDKKANYIKHALREYNIHKKLDHIRIIKLYDVFEIDENSFCTVLEYNNGTDLDIHLKQSKYLPEREARSIVIQVVSALRYLNEIKPPIIHYDLKPGNILLGSGVYSGEVKITDFGLSKIMEDSDDSNSDGLELTSQGAGTYWYLPPECFMIGRAPPKISSKVDVWSVGVLLYQCLYGRKPFGHDMSQSAILEQKTILKAVTVDFPSKPAVSSEAKNFVRRCLQYRKEDRPDVLSLCDDPYLRPKKLVNQSSSNVSSISSNSLP